MHQIAVRFKPLIDGFADDIGTDSICGPQLLQSPKQILQSLSPPRPRVRVGDEPRHLPPTSRLQYRFCRTITGGFAQVLSKLQLMMTSAAEPLVLVATRSGRASTSDVRWASL